MVALRVAFTAGVGRVGVGDVAAKVLKGLSVGVLEGLPIVWSRQGAQGILDRLGGNARRNGVAEDVGERGRIASPALALAKEVAPRRRDELQTVLLALDRISVGEACLVSAVRQTRCWKHKVRVVLT